MFEFGYGLEWRYQGTANRTIGNQNMKLGVLTEQAAERTSRFGKITIS